MLTISNQSQLATQFDLHLVVGVETAFARDAGAIRPMGKIAWFELGWVRRRRKFNRARLRTSPVTLQSIHDGTMMGDDRGETARYTAFWHGLGATFPSLKGAPSTSYYFECEQMVWERYFPPLRDCLLLKTDLWNEAKSTEILRWAADQGAKAVGIDIAFDTVRQARHAFQARRSGLLVSDVRSLPFSSDTFDLVYSMGTIEHFADYEVAVQELWRVLKPRGIAIVGVPNKLDPFLRPLLVSVLNRLNVYAYGSEKSFTPRELRGLLRSAGFVVNAETSLLFLPGWLRLLDLWCHTRFRRLTALTGPLVKPFAWLYRRVPLLRRHGYLIACVVEKPAR